MHNGFERITRRRLQICATPLELRDTWICCRRHPDCKYNFILYTRCANIMAFVLLQVADACLGHVSKQLFKSNLYEKQLLLIYADTAENSLRE